MSAHRIAAVVFATIVLGGEIYRSWGERAVALWLDDFLVAVALVLAALLLNRATPRRAALMTGAWGFAVGVIFISFFDKILLPAMLGPGAEFHRLNLFVTLELAVAIAGLFASTRLSSDA